MEAIAGANATAAGCSKAAFTDLQKSDRMPGPVMVPRRGHALFHRDQT